MKEKPIGIFDSGMGGITILYKVMEYLPNEDYIYYGDSLNNPYGEKSEEEIVDCARNVTKFLLNKGCKAIVIACNTASSVAVDILREEFPDTIFIATIPSLKVALDQDKNQNILVMATNATLNSKKFRQLYDSYKEEHNHIHLLNCSGLAHLIEEEVEIKINDRLKELLTFFQDKNIKTVVLGCTHYPLIEKNIASYFINAKLIDGSDGIKRQLERKLKEKELLNLNDKKGSLTIYNSLGDNQVHKTLHILKQYQKQMISKEEKHHYFK